MTDHADVIREIVDARGNEDHTPEDYDAALAALAALEQELAEAKAQYETVNREWGVCAGRMVAAETRVKELESRHQSFNSLQWAKRAEAAELALETFKKSEAMETVRLREALDAATKALLHVGELVGSGIRQEEAFDTYVNPDFHTALSVARAALAATEDTP